FRFASSSGSADRGADAVAAGTAGDAGSAAGATLAVVLRRIEALGRARMSVSAVPGGGGRSLYWTWPPLSRHFHCAAAGRAIRLAARRASRATNGLAMVSKQRVKNWRAV